MMSGRSTGINETSEVVKSLLWRYVRYEEGVGIQPITRYEGGMIVVCVMDGYQYRRILGG